MSFLFHNKKDVVVNIDMFASLDRVLHVFEKHMKARKQCKITEAQGSNVITYEYLQESNISEIVKKTARMAIGDKVESMTDIEMHVTLTKESEKKQAVAEVKTITFQDHFNVRFVITFLPNEDDSVVTVQHHIYIHIMGPCAWIPGATIVNYSQNKSETGLRDDREKEALMLLDGC